MSTAKRPPKKTKSGGDRVRARKLKTDEEAAAGDDDFALDLAAERPRQASRRSTAPGDAEPAAIVPARRLTPEARAAVNAMVAKGVSLQEALRATAKWETFVAPVREPAPTPVRPEGARFNSSEEEEAEGPAADEESDDGEFSGE